MNDALIEALLALFWAGFIGLNLWLWRCNPLEESGEQSAEQTRINKAEVNEGERHATYHH